MPSLSSETTLLMCCFLVSGFLTEIIQQIHSLRASGDISSHNFRASVSEVKAVHKSSGTSCTTPAEIFFIISLFTVQILAGYT